MSLNYDSGMAHDDDEDDDGMRRTDDGEEVTLAVVGGHSKHCRNFNQLSLLCTSNLYGPQL